MGTGVAMEMTPESASPEPVDPVDAAAATVDARSPDAGEMIEEVAEVAQDVGRDVDPDDPGGEAGDRGGA
jgi:hypothetical protein